MEKQKSEKGKKALKIISCILVSLVTMLYFLYAFGGIQLKEEFTGKKFVVFSTNEFDGSGSVTYCRRSGIFLHSKQKFELSMLLMDPPSFKIYGNEIFVNATFMGQGATFPINESANYRLSIKPHLEYHFGKDNEIIEIESRSLTYYNFDTKEERIENINNEQYKYIKMKIKELSLVPTTWEQENVYIKWEREDNGSETAYVDGAELFDIFKKTYFK